MKCIKKASEVKRVDDEDAVMLVKSGWAYCPKSEWKARRPAKSNKVVDIADDDIDEIEVSENIKNSKNGKKGKKVKKFDKADKADKVNKDLIPKNSSIGINKGDFKKSKSSGSSK